VNPHRMRQIEQEMDRPPEETNHTSRNDLSLARRTTIDCTVYELW
jgi:hypothetical protein